MYRVIITLITLNIDAFTLFMGFKITSLNFFLVTLVTFIYGTNILVCVQQMFLFASLSHCSHLNRSCGEITKLCSFIVQIYKLKRIHQDESCWKPLVVTIIQCFEYDHTGHIYIDVDLVYVSWDFMFELLYSHTVYIYI